MIDLKAAPFFLTDEDVEWVEKTIAEMSFDEKIGQLFCPIGLTYDEDFLRYLTCGLHVGGVLFRAGPGREIRAAHECLQKNSRIPLLIAANVETGGDGIADDGTAVGEQMNIAAAGDLGLAEKLGEVAAAEGRAVGLNWAFGPIADIDMNWRNPITNVRTFGSSPERVRDMTLAVHRGLMNNGLISCAKHFPGDGTDERDQHLLTSVNSLSMEKWDESYGMVYRALIEDSVPTIMAGHIRLPAWQKEDDLPATLSKELLTGLLRERLGFNGLIISDATPMVGFCCAMERRKAVPAAIEAGCDMFLFNKCLEEDIEYMKEGVRSGLLSEKRLDEALHRILALKKVFLINRGNDSVPAEEKLEVLACEKHRKIAEDCADRSITLVRDRDGLLPITPEKHRRVLLEVLGGFPSEERVKKTVAAKLEKEGFEVHHYVPENFDTLVTSVEEFRKSYDLVLYIGNIENVSNQTVARIKWNTFFGHGNNIPWFVKETDTVFIGVGNPYLSVDVPMIPCYVNTYFNSDLYLETVIDKILGKSQFKGAHPGCPIIEQ